MKNRLGLLFVLATTVSAGTALADPCPDGAEARAAVMAYLTAMHEHRFEDAYDFVSEGMTDGRGRADWSALQRNAYQPGKVDIYGVDIRQAMAAQGDPQCASRAIVPNILSSRDKLNVHGNVEFEIYTVIRLDTGWRIDAQETLFDDAAVATWFPDSRVIEAGTSE